MHIKKLLFSLLFVFLCYSAFSFSLNEIKDIEKIRWIDCGENLFDFKEIEEMEFCFDIPKSLNYYKIYEINNVQYKSRGENDIIKTKKGLFSVLFEYKENFYIIRYDSAFINYLNNRPLEYYENNHGYLDKINEAYQRDDLKDFSFTNFCVKYLNIQNNSNYLIIKKIPSRRIIGTVYLTNKNYIINECGRHFISFDNNTFTSDSIFSNSNNNELYSNDNDAFKIIILKYSDREKLLLLDTPKYTRPYVPMEDFFTVNTDEVILKKKYEERKDNFIIYDKPDFNSKKIKILEGKDQYFVKIIGSNETLEEFDGKISKWVKIKFNDGFEGWIWGRNITLYTWPNGYDPEKLNRYIEYNTIKK